jgi:hypothetical protein
MSDTITFNDLMNIDPTKLIIHVVIVALSTLGFVEWLKNFIKPKCKNVFAILGMLMVLINVTMQVQPSLTLTTWWNLAMLGGATMQFGHAALIKLPDKLLSRLDGGKV